MTVDKMNRPSANPGGMECQTCGRIFIGDESHSECGLCQNTRPTAVASHAEGEVVAWRLRIGDSDQWSFCSTESDADFYGKQSGMTYEKERLYTHPRATSAEVERDAARYRWLLANDVKVETETWVWEQIDDNNTLLSDRIDAAMAARGDDK